MSNKFKISCHGEIKSSYHENVGLDENRCHKCPSIGETPLDLTLAVVAARDQILATYFAGVIAKRLCRLLEQTARIVIRITRKFKHLVRELSDRSPNTEPTAFMHFSHF